MPLVHAQKLSTAPADGAAAAAAVAGSGGKTWSVGTLVYNRAGLVNVFFWMLWGDFCLSLMDGGVGRYVVPLQLKKYGASNTLIAVVNKSLIELIILVLCPVISTWSDRH